MLSDSQRAERARHAQRLMDDEVLNSALDLMEERYIQELRDTAIHQEGERNQLWHRWQSVLHFRRELQMMIEDGHLLSMKLEKSRKLEMRVTRYG